MKKYLTLMFISHNEGYIKDYHLSRPIFLGIVSALCLLPLLAFGFIATMGKRERIAELKEENTALERQFVLIQEELENMRHNMDQLQEKDRIMRAWVDLSEPSDEVRQIGVGGGDAIPPEWANAVSAEVSDLLTNNRTNMDQLLREAHFLQTSLIRFWRCSAKTPKCASTYPQLPPCGWKIREYHRVLASAATHSPGADNFTGASIIQAAEVRPLSPQLMG